MKHFLSFVCIIALVFGGMLLSNCKKDVPQNPVQQNTTATHFMKGMLGGEVIMIQTNPSYYTNVSNQPDADGDNDNNEENHNADADEDLSTLITGCEWFNTAEIGNTTLGSVEMRKEVFRIYVTPFMNNPYYGMLNPGTYNFAYQHNSSSGAYITVRDKAGVLWTSKGDQTGSTFQITTRGTNKQTFATIAGTVNCKMYDSYGNMKLFTGGSFVANSGL